MRPVGESGHELKAERDGVVKAVSAKAGDPVAADNVLVEFA